MKRLALVSILFLGACATSASSVEISYSTALAGAYAYVKLDPCPAPTKIACSQTDIVKKIEVAKRAADQALLVVRKVESRDTLAAANQAVSAFTTIVSMPEVQAAISK